MGNALLEAKQNEPAEDAYREALNAAEFIQSLSVRAQASVAAHNNYGVLLAEQGRSQEAAEHFQQALKLNPGYAEAQYNYANLLSRPQEAEEHCRRARELGQSDTEYPE